LVNWLKFEFEFMVNQPEIITTTGGNPVADNQNSISAGARGLLADRLDFESLVADYYKPLYKFAFSLTRNEADACDLVQQSFCIWANKGQQLRDATKVKTWLFTTLHREFLGARRKQARFPQVDLEYAAVELPVVQPATVNHLDTAQMLVALSRLDEIYQAPVALFYLQDYSYNEIATILDVPLGTVKSRLARGLRRLHQLLTAFQPAARHVRATETAL
jgi:RNA polymerase sigma-70 factor, ECF subfamily